MTYSVYSDIIYVLEIRPIELCINLSRRILVMVQKTISFIIVELKVMYLYAAKFVLYALQYREKLE